MPSKITAPSKSFRAADRSRKVFENPRRERNRMSLKSAALRPGDGAELDLESGSALGKADKRLLHRGGHIRIGQYVNTTMCRTAPTPPGARTPSPTNASSD